MKTYDFTQEFIIKRTISVCVEAESLEQAQKKKKKGEYHLRMKFDSLPEFVSATVTVNEFKAKKKRKK